MEFLARQGRSLSKPYSYLRLTFVHSAEDDAAELRSQYMKDDPAYWRRIMLTRWIKIFHALSYSRPPDYIMVVTAEHITIITHDESDFIIGLLRHLRTEHNHVIHER